MSKKRKVDVNIYQDKISELPKNLIESILERLSIKEAARTSILSTKWRFIWTKIPKLILDRRFIDELTPNKRTQSYRFVQVVDTILMVHNGPIHKFVISIPFSQTPNMDIWILYLSRNGVKELTFRNNYYSHFYMLPSYIFSCDQLTYLSLYKCVLNAPLEFTGFCNLRELLLDEILLSTNTASLISTLPFLSSLELCSCLGVENINYLPPNLSSLNLIGGRGVQWQQWFQTNTKISVVRIYLFHQVKNVDVQGKLFNLNSFLSNLPNLTILWLNDFAHKFLAAGILTEFHQLSHKLKQINLTTLCFSDLDQVSSALYLLKSSPNLEKLEIQASFNSDDELEQHVLSYIVNIADSDLKLNCLRSAKLGYFTGLKAELAFVKLILSHSPVLRQMEITSKGGMDADNEMVFLIQLMSFCRASVESKIIYTRGEIY